MLVKERHETPCEELLGMDRIIRRAYESATSVNRSTTSKWHEQELMSVRAYQERRLKNAVC